MFEDISEAICHYHLQNKVTFKQQKLILRQIFEGQPLSIVRAIHQANIYQDQNNEDIQKFKSEAKAKLPNIQFQQKIIKLQKQEQSIEQSLTLQDLKKIQSIFQWENFNKLFGGSYLFSVVLRQLQQYRFGKINNLILLQMHYYEQAQQLLNKLKQIIKPFKYIQIKENIVELQEIPSGTYCVECKKEFGNSFYFWCKWDSIPHQFRCYQCINSRDANGYFIYKQNSVLLQANTKNIRIQKSRFGKNIQPQSNQEKQNYQQRMICSYCDGKCPPNTTRYICLRCKYQPIYQKDQDFVDLCEPCMKLYLQGDRRVYWKLKLDNHNSNHPFLRVLYPTDSYYKY